MAELGVSYCQEAELSKLEFFLRTISAVIDALEASPQSQKPFVATAREHLTVAADNLATTVWYLRKEVGVAYES